MGLDTVELLLSTEELFGIEIPDDDASEIVTVGELRDYIAAKLIQRGDSSVNADIVFDQLRTLICQHLGVEPHQVVPGARFVDDLHAD